MKKITYALIAVILNISLAACQSEITDPSTQDMSNQNGSENEASKSSSCSPAWNLSTYEPNASDCDAFPLELSKTYRTALENTTDKEDWFYVDAQANQTYIAEITNLSTQTLSSSKQLIAMVQDSNAVTIKQWGYISTNTTVFISFTAITTGRITIKFKTPSDQDFVYQLTVYPTLQNGLEQDITTFEPNDLSVIAKPIETTQTYTSAVNTSNDKNDWYVINDVNLQSNYTFTGYDNTNYGSTYTRITNDGLYLDIYDENQVLLHKDIWVSNVSAINLNIMTAGGNKLYLKFSNRSETYSHSYTFTITAQ